MKYENEMFQDLMGIVVETGDKWLDKKLNSHICYKGGGGGTTTTTANIDPALKPSILNVARRTSAALNTGQLSQVAKTDASLARAQEAALGRTGELRESAAQGRQANLAALQGTGIFAAQDLSGQKAALSAQAADQLGQQFEQQGGIASAQGTLGGRRADFGMNKAQALANANLAVDFGKLDAADLAARRNASAAARGDIGSMNKLAMADVDVQRGVGKERMAQDQRELDSVAKGLQTASGILYGNPLAKGQTQTQSGGGGK
jgi:hypothetical protein